MSFEYKVLELPRKVADKVTCDRCDKDIKKVGEGGWNQYGIPFTVFHEPSFESFFELEQSWGYHSSKDGQIHRATICESCYDAIFKDVRIKVERYL